MHTLIELLEDQVKDLYSVENQQVKALPMVIKHVSSQNLRAGLELHRIQTQQHVSRLEKVAKIIGFKPGGKRCRPMESLIAEITLAIKKKGNAAVVDTGLVAAAQRVEHYEMSAYSTAIALAAHLGFSDVALHLEENLKEECDAHSKLTEVCESEILASAPLETRHPPEAQRFWI